MNDDLTDAEREALRIHDAKVKERLQRNKRVPIEPPPAPTPQSRFAKPPSALEEKAEAFAQSVKDALANVSGWKILIGIVKPFVFGVCLSVPIILVIEMVRHALGAS